MARASAHRELRRPLRLQSQRTRRSAAHSALPAPAARAARSLGGVSRGADAARYGRRIPAGDPARLASGRARFRGRTGRLAAWPCAYAVPPLAARVRATGHLEDRSRAALGVPDTRGGALAMAARGVADPGIALRDHLSDTQSPQAPRPRAAGALSGALARGHGSVPGSGCGAAMPTAPAVA